MATTPVLYIPKVKYESSSASFATLPTLALNGTSGLTISFWFYRTAVGTETFLYFGKYQSTYIQIHTLQAGTPYKMYLTLNDFPFNIFHEFNTINTWNHFAVTLTYSAENTSTHKVYANGILSSTTANRPYPTSTYARNKIGQFTGFMDELSIYNTVLSDTDIGSIYSTTQASLLPPPYEALWYSTKVNLESDDSEIFNGHFVAVKQNSTDTQGLITRFYDASNAGVDIIAYNNYYGADRLFAFDTLRFTYSGTNITTFPYIKTLYSNAAFYTFYQQDIPNGLCWVAPLDVTGESLATSEDVRVKLTTTQISGRPPPIPVTAWYSTNVKLSSDNTEIFNGYFSVVRDYVSDYQGLVNHFYDTTNRGVDIFVNNGFYGEDYIYRIDTNKFSYGGTNITSFPYLKNLYSSAGFFQLFQENIQNGVSGIVPLNIIGDNLLTNGFIPATIINTEISGPPALMKASLNNGSIWVVGGSSIATSIDGKTWTTVPSSPTNVNSLAFTGSQWIACCDGSNNIYSGTSDANSWYLSRTLSSYNLFKVAFANNTLFALSTGKIFYSTDLNLGAWSSYSAAVGDITGFAYTGSKFLFSSATNLISTQNLNAWTVTAALPSITKSLSINNSAQGAATVKPIVIACTDSSFNTLGYTYDGIRWYGCGSTALQTRANHAAWSGSLWVAVGKSASTWFSWSRDGISWIGQPDTLFGEAFSIAWNGSIWVAAGEGAAFSLATSSDGITWTGVPGSKTIFVDRATDIKWTGAQWVACGSPSIVAKSFNATTWTLIEDVLVGDLSSVLFSFTTTATSNSGTAQNAFDLSSATAWTSQTGAYDAVTGAPTGTVENVQVTFTSSKVVNQYFLQSSAIDWVLEGSTNGSTWVTLHAIVNSTRSFFSFANTTPYTYYRVVFYKIAANSGLTSVRVTNVDFFQRQALSKFYRMNNTKRGVSYFVNTGYSSWLQQYDGSAVLTPVKRATSFSYDGKYGVITDLSTNSVFYTTEIDVSLASVAFGNASYASCFNGTHFLVGRTNSRIAYAHPSNMSFWFTVTVPFTGGNILSLVSNSGIGFASPPNSLCLDPGDKLSLVAPKFYDINMVGRAPTFNFGLTR